MPIEKEKERVTKAQANFDIALRSYPHLRAYIDEIARTTGTPSYHTELSFELKKESGSLNILYPVGDQLFVHAYRDEKGKANYHVVEPELDDKTLKILEKVLDRMIEIIHRLPVPKEDMDIVSHISTLLNKIVSISTFKTVAGLGMNRILVTPEQYVIIKYFLLRNLVGFSKLEPLLNDPYIEDIHCTGIGNVKLVHKIFGMMYTNIKFPEDISINKYMLETSERVERPVSNSRPVVDAIMPDGSRVNFIFGRDISREGSSFTIRKFSEVPISIINLCDFNTISDEIAAYLWLIIEAGMNIFICGETASGKTTTLNATSVFISPDKKVYTVENTPEVTLPHKTWQHLVTREAGKDTDVDMFDLLLAALRSRPDYVIVGEIRGKEGNVAFQAMQTGHPVMSTFHAGSVHSMVQRLTGHPIDVPISFVDNLNVVLIQQTVSVNNQLVRRVLSVSEIERYYDVENKVVSRRVFVWDRFTDNFYFSGYHNSYILEKKVAPKLGIDANEIYNELERRAEIISKMRQGKIFNYYEVWRYVKLFYQKGVSAMNEALS
jgi:flagellar protein FlaI